MSKTVFTINHPIFDTIRDPEITPGVNQVQLQQLLIAANRDPGLNSELTIANAVEAGSDN